MLKKSHQKIAFNTLYLILATIINSILSFVRQIFIASFIGPSQFGTWNLIRTLLGYSNYLDLGANTGVLYERPKFIGTGEIIKATKIRQQGFLFVLALSIILSILIILISFLPIKILNENSTILFFLAASIPLFSLINFYNVEARIVGNFKVLSISMIIAGTTSLLFTVLISIFVQKNIIEWVVISWLSGMLLSLFYLIINIHVSLIVKPNFEIIKTILLVGFTLSLVPIIIILFRTVDRWVLTSIVSAIDFGYYAFGMTIGMFLYTIPNTLGVVLSTNLIQRFGATGDPKTSKSLITVSIFLTSYLMAFIAGGVAIIIPFLLNHYLQSYLPGENLIKLVIIASCALFALPIASNFLLSIERKKIVFHILILMIISEIFLIWILSVKFGIYGGAIAVLITSIFGNALFLASTFTKICLNLSVALLNTIKTIVPFFLLVSISILVDHNLHMKDIFWEDLQNTILFGIYYTLLCVPVSIIFFWFSKSLDIIKHAIKNNP